MWLIAQRIGHQIAPNVLAADVDPQPRLDEAGLVVGLGSQPGRFISPDRRGGLVGKLELGFDRSPELVPDLPAELVEIDQAGRASWSVGRRHRDSNAWVVLVDWIAILANGPDLLLQTTELEPPDRGLAMGLFGPELMDFLLGRELLELVTYFLPPIGGDRV